MSWNAVAGAAYSGGPAKPSPPPRAPCARAQMPCHAGADALNPGPIADTRQAHGAFLRASLGHDLTLMAEGDLLLHTQTKPGYVGFAQLDFEPIQGLHFFGTGEVLDNGYPKQPVLARAPGTGKPKWGGWLSAQWFFATHFDFRLDTIVRENEPTQLLGQIHVYL